MTVSVVLGKASMTIAEFENLEPGDLIKLDRAPDATVDLFINGVHAAEGDVIVIDDHVAARIGHLHMEEAADE
jgi:flagellar motor switch/type III secretory pathway protein FliN